MIIGAKTLGGSLPLSNPMVDWIGIVFSIFGFGGVLYGLSAIGSEGFAYLPAWAAMIVGAIFIGLFIQRTVHSNQPLLNVRLLKNKSFLLSILISMFALMTLVGANNIMPIYVQSVLGRSAFISGLITMPGAILKSLGSPVSGRIYDEFGIQRLGPIGSGMMVIGTSLLLFLSPDTAIFIPILIYFLIYGGFCLLNIPITTAGMNTLKEEELSHGTAVRQTIRGLGSTFSTAMAFSTLSFISSAFTQHGSTGVNMSGIRGAFGVAVFCALSAFILTLFFKEKVE